MKAGANGGVIRTTSTHVSVVSDLSHSDSSIGFDFESHDGEISRRQESAGILDCRTLRLFPSVKCYQMFCWLRSRNSMW